MRRAAILAAGALLAVGILRAVPAHGSSRAAALEPASLAHAQTIRARIGARYRARGLAVTEASSTGVVETFALLTPDLLRTRFLPAGNGIYYAICPVRATCPYPSRRFARPAADIVTRRLALELAVKTFLETTADVVAVSLPTARFTAFIVEQKELAREVDLRALAKELGGDPTRDLPAPLRRLVDRVTRPRVFLAAGLEPTPSGRDNWAGVPRWPMSPTSP